MVRRRSRRICCTHSAASCATTCPRSGPWGSPQGMRGSRRRRWWRCTSTGARLRGCAPASRLRSMRAWSSNTATSRLRSCGWRREALLRERPGDALSRGV
ncbi:hypothetical protein ACFPRL_30150 [Pseudoclavibacter helvolus]